MGRDPTGLQPQAEWQRCTACGHDALEMVKQEPHPIFGILGMTIDHFLCRACGVAAKEPADVAPRLA